MDAGYEDGDYEPKISDMGEGQKAACIRAMAFDLFQYSCPDSGGDPTISPERAFTLAEEFLVEAERRGY